MAHSLLCSRRHCTSPPCYLLNYSYSHNSTNLLPPSVGGYPKMSTFGAVVGERFPEGRDEFLRYHNAAIEIPSPAISRIEAISRETDIFLVIGVIERDGGTLYCTAIFIDPKEGYVGKHRKLVPTASERLIWGQGNGSTLPVLEKSFSTSGSELQSFTTKISATICWWVSTSPIMHPS